MSVDFVARALAQRAGQGQGFTVLATGIGGVEIPASIKIMQTSGYAADGEGAGAYVCDSLATSALAAAHPRFCKTDAGGRHWRLLPDDNSLIPVACGGVNGSGLIASHAADEQPGIQAAIAYCEAVGAQGTRYDAASYSLWRKHRTASAVFDIHADKSGLLLQTAMSHRFVSTCGQTTLYRRDADGSAMGKAKFDTCTGSGGYYWRGGGIFTEGQSSAPADVSENSIYLYDVVLDGGITDSSEQDNPFGAFMDASGDGWDISDKGIWQSNDRYCGHIVLEGRSAIRYFMGELIYGSGVGASIAQRRIRIGPDVDLGHTCGSCLNGNGQTLEVEHCHLHNGFIGVEGWTGELGGYFKARVSNTDRNTLQGGIPNFGAGSYFTKARPTPGIVPMGEVDMVLNGNAGFDIGSWISGRITSVDCYPSLGNGAAFPDGSQECDLDIVTYLDQGSLNGGIAILGGASGSMATNRVSVRLSCKRTDNAVSNNHTFAQAVYCYGSFGSDVTVKLGALEGMVHAPMAPAGTVYDHPIKVLDWNFDTFAAPYYYYDIEANNGATIDIKAYGNVIATQCTTNGSYIMNLPTAGVPSGYRLFVRDTTKNFVAGGGACRIPAGNFRAGCDVIVPPGYGYTELEFDGQAWSVVTPPPKLSATAAWDPASIGAGSSGTTSVPLIGAVPGDEVTTGFSVDLQGMVLNAHVSAANTVTAVLFNPTGAAVDLASGTLRVTAG